MYIYTHTFQFKFCRAFTQIEIEQKIHVRQLVIMFHQTSLYSAPFLPHYFLKIRQKFAYD